MLNNTSFSIRLKKVMDFYNISASSFAETIEVPRSSISHILSGRNKPSLEFVLKTIETYQEVDLYWLLKGIGNFPKSSTPPPNLKPKKEQKTTNQKSTEEILEPKPTIQEKTRQTNESTFSHTSSNIEKVLVFYTNGTFKEYKNQDQ